MVWPFSSSEDTKASDGDPLRDLDPGLREFLKSQSPVKYEPESYSGEATSAQPVAVPPIQQQSQTLQEEPPADPSHAKSLFKDGRYDHLWKTYKPLAEVEAASKSDQEKLMDVLAGYKDKTAAVKKGAMENCAEEDWNLKDCFSNGSWSKRMVMCRDETRSLQRCIVMQAVSASAIDLSLD